MPKIRENDTRGPASARLIRLRARLGFSQRDLAREFRVSAGAIGFWESGARPVPGSILKLLEQYEQYWEPPLEARDRIGKDLGERLARELLQSLGKNRFALSAEQQGLLQQSLIAFVTTSLSSDPIRQRIQTSSIEHLIRSYRRLKGLPLKILQFSSYTSSNFPAELRDLLYVFQNLSRPMPSGVVASVIEEELGKPPHRLFQSWEPKPFASASIGQVHRARLRSGEEVAVKVQYPGLTDSIRELERNPKKDSCDFLLPILRDVPAMVVNELQELLLRECDYTLEAENLLRFRQIFSDQDEVYLPELHGAYCSQRVLTMEFIDGKSLSLAREELPAEKRNEVAARIMRFQLRALFDHDLLYADPHLGNFLLQGERLVALDFGRVFNYGQSALRNEGTLMWAILRDRPETGREKMEALELLTPQGQLEFTEVWSFLRKQHSHMLDDAEFEYTLEYCQQRNELAVYAQARGWFKPNRELFWHNFCGITLGAIRAGLRAKGNWRKLMQDAIVRRFPEIQ